MSKRTIFDLDADVVGDLEPDAGTAGRSPWRRQGLHPQVE
jgi:hypothetical protein